MKILVIPGIGDVHWVLLKLESWIEQNCKGEIPEVWVWNFDDRPRSGDFIKRIPFVKFGGYWNQKKMTEQQKHIFRESYITGKKSEYKDFCGFDYYLCVNGELRIGKSITSILPQYSINWDYKINLDGIKKPYSEPYIIFYFSNHGMFQNWVNHFPPEKIANYISKIGGYKLLLTGSSWDSEFNSKIKADNIDNICGETSLDELLGLITNASAFIGWCGGNTIISQHLNTPTLMLWSNYFIKQFQTNWVEPKKLGKTYIPLNVENLSEGVFFDNVKRILAVD